MDLALDGKLCEALVKGQNLYQIALISFAVLATCGIGFFAYHELFPDYKKYQVLYEELEEFRSSYTHEQPAPFTKGIKQILIPNDNGPEVIDRCISCHVAVDLPHFSPTRPSQDAQGKIITNEEGALILEPNPDYVWRRLDEKIAQLQKENKTIEATKLSNLKVISSEGKQVQVEKVLQMHPLIGSETRPFQLHPMGEYGCTSCHGGNGRALTAKRAHGPLFDGDYEPAAHGVKPQFLEKDEQNDPPFSKMYNSKPGHDLAFQTTPLLAGPVMAANCIQCHQPKAREPTGSKTASNADKLIASYQRGKDLFISQACYVCHRIAGFSRASIGPELTKAGLSYPWYIKESIVWPQADLPSSVMPNFRLDHEELADLMAFLMAQKGETKTVSEVDYLTHLKSWENGKKMPWEQPVSPTQIANLREGQIVFASEGCASCHKLQGFSSNIGFAEQAVVDTEFQQDREWFLRFFPEQITGKNLAKRIEEHAEEIDLRILPNVRSDSILEEISEKFPDLLTSFYPNFKYAARAYNKDFSEKRAAYQDRLHRVLMVYIQEYGLGRDIAPHLNWSGVWRDDDWLFGHFRNPSAFVAKSLMPALPFDDSKFYMLNHMLHFLGEKNRDKLVQMWQTEGFDPPEAYEMLCSSCHGTERQGNGPVSQWIYPIPKNLRNPLFLRSLTKEQAAQAIANGVPGTPMPPWGQTVSEEEEKKPVLNEQQIKQLVDWIYQGIPEEVPQMYAVDADKWHYTPEDAVAEMIQEKDLLYPLSPDETHSISEYFEKDSEKNHYFIREKYYTSENLEAGKRCFLENCAVCHGNEGTGAGLRASSMVEAKPRMLTNLPWISSRDDLRLLRSIKFGVPGTAMTPWGDQTCSTQRMQLVMFIRSLTSDAARFQKVENAVNETFGSATLLVQQERLNEYFVFKQADEKYKKVHSKLKALLEIDGSDAEEINVLYAAKTQLKKEREATQQKDKSYVDLVELLKQEKEIYLSIAAQLIASNLTKTAFEMYLEAVFANPMQFSLIEEKLSLEKSRAKTEKRNLLLANLVHHLESNIAALEQQIAIEQKKFQGEKINKTLQKLQGDKQNIVKLLIKLQEQIEKLQVVEESLLRCCQYMKQ